MGLCVTLTIKNTELASEWQRSARHAAAVEMELGGVYLAARYGGDGSTRVLAIRGISDIVGYKRQPEWTAFACRSAAAFTYALITSYFNFACGRVVHLLISFCGYRKIHDPGSEKFWIVLHPDGLDPLYRVARSLVSTHPYG
jgi:hypothetical protein